MKIKGQNIRFKQLIALCVYYGLCYWLPPNYISPRFIGRFLRRMRGAVCGCIFQKVGKDINIERGATFGLGTGIVIGDYSGIGPKCHVPADTVIGNYVMMAANCYILAANHRFDDLDKPMVMQGNTERRRTVIEDDVWIGRNVLMTPGRHISRGSIIAAGCVLCKDFPEYSIVGGNPSRFIKSRKADK